MVLRRLAAASSSCKCCDCDVYACSYKRKIDAALSEGEPEAVIDELVAEAQSAISSILTVIRSNALGAQSAQGASMLQLEGYAASQPPSMTSLVPAGMLLFYRSGGHHSASNLLSSAK